MQNKVINVFYHGHKVGRLASSPERVLAFEYDAGWLSDGFSISPFHLPLEKKVFIAPTEPFGGNFGVFDDSLPDGWGRLLTDRMLRRHGIDTFSVSLLDRLAIVGTNGAGALEYKPAENLTAGGKISDLNTLAAEAAAILNETDDGRSLLEMVKLGGSSGGARPKVLLNVDDADWIIKFPANGAPKNIGKLEYKYMMAARDAGLQVPETRLFENKYFGAMRFDRKPNGEKVFMVSSSGLLNTSHRAPTLDYNDLMSATFAITRDIREVEKMFRLMCFNVYAHNRDDHSKNFAFLYDKGKWSVAPAYDLVYNIGLGGEHATMINGNGRNPTDDDIMAVAQRTGITPRRATDIMEQVKSAVKKLNL
ncbi:MAG: type II toxin-antitoxin system HipA family toxin [Rickettsiales bacterium]|jgi:serine/threonine-protein kinase HipA|nr:type II toxin-antitoxin system HipA family toxin [Rickettsiales bacterium]